ncbi:MAG TPA: nuclear transport factor 2 family protein [Blastocatellia bacterium]|nr:nuclear transport factor 2 family protein [Blastocatellia bacterium]
MSLENNKQLARRFFDCFSSNDVAAGLNLLSDDATWWIAGKPEQLPAAGSHSKKKIARLFQTMAGQLPDGLKMTVKSLIAEGDRVALEVESLGRLQNGRVYNQQYHFLVTIRDEKICAVKEYLDTQHVFSTWFQS